MSDDQQSHRERVRAPATTAAPSTLPGTLIPRVTVSSPMLTFPLSNTAAIFGPSPFLSNTAAATAVISPHLPLSFVAPSGQIFISPSLPVSPSLPFISTACLVPQPTLSAHQLAANFPFPPFSSPSTSSAPFQQSVPLNLTKSDTFSGSRDSSELFKASPSPLLFSQASISQAPSVIQEKKPARSGLISSPLAVTSRAGSIIAHSHLHFPPQQSPAPLTDPAPLSAPRESSSQATSHGETHTHFKEQSETSSSSLKTLLTTDKAQEPHEQLREKLEKEPDLFLFYKSFLSSSQSSHLHLEYLPSQAGLKWLQVRQKELHIDPELGPVTVARILVSSNGIVKLQLLFPIYKTVFTKLFAAEEIENLLSELSPDHVICPGLLNYTDKFSVLGYHPSHVRVFESAHVKRYDHEHCPIWHVPTGTFTKRDRTAQKMCKQCKYLQNSVVRLATKACEVDPAERESWTNPSSNRPLAYMSAADREERYRKLRQERNQMLVKLRAYEERLGIGSGGEAAGSKLHVCAKPVGSEIAAHLVTVTQPPSQEEEEEKRERGGGGEELGPQETASEQSSESDSSEEGRVEGSGVSEVSGVKRGSVYTAGKRRSSIELGQERKRPVKRAKSSST